MAEAALRSAPPTTATPKPVTFMPSFEKLRSPEFCQPDEVVRPVAVPQQAPQEAAGTEIRY